MTQGIKTLEMKTVIMRVKQRHHEGVIDIGAGHSREIIEITRCFDPWIFISCCKGIIPAVHVARASSQLYMWQGHHPSCTCAIWHFLPPPPSPPPATIMQQQRQQQQQLGHELDDDLLQL